jgi:molecular chaperone GrpE
MSKPKNAPVDDQTQVDPEELGEELEAQDAQGLGAVGASDSDEVARLTEELAQARAAERRAVADYQNLLRRTQEERVKMMKFAGRDVIESILQPLEHLFLAKEQLKDQGLNMVYQQFQQALRSEGLEEIECLGKEFDPQTMEAISYQKAEAAMVSKVALVSQRGYKLNGEVIRPAKVIIGTDK